MAFRPENFCAIQALQDARDAVVVANNLAPEIEIAFIRIARLHLGALLAREPGAASLPRGGFDEVQEHLAEAIFEIMDNVNDVDVGMMDFAKAIAKQLLERAIPEAGQ